MRILEACSEEIDGRDIALERVLSDHLPYDAIGGNDIEHVQSFDGCCRQCGPTLIRLCAAIAGNLRVAGLE